MLKIRGFSLVELIVVVVLIAILIGAAAPSVADMIRNSRIRGMTDSIVNGLNFAKAEAVRRNKIVRFQLVDSMDDSCSISSSGRFWVVSEDDPSGNCGAVSYVDGDGDTSVVVDSPILQKGSFEGIDSVNVETSGDGIIAFNSLGRLAFGANALSIDVKSSDADLSCATESDLNAVRCLQIGVSTGGKIRMCDPALPSSNTQSCAYGG